MAPATKRGREASDDGQRVGKKRKAVAPPSGERRVTRGMKITRKEVVNATFWATFDIVFLITELLPAKNVLSLYNASRVFHQHVEDSVKLQGRLFITSDANHKYVHTEAYDEVAALKGPARSTSYLPHGYKLTHPTPHLNDIIFNIFPEAVQAFSLYGAPSTGQFGERGQHLGVTSDGLSTEVEITATRVFDPRLLLWEEAPVLLGLEIQISLDQGSEDQGAEYWYEDSSCNSMFLTQPPVQDVKCWIEVKSWDAKGRRSLPAETFIIQNEDGLTFGDVWEEADRAKREAGGKLKKVERKPRRVGIQSARPGGWH